MPECISHTGVVDMRSSEFHVEQNDNVPEASRHRWLIESATNTVVCAHSDQQAAQRCCDGFKQEGSRQHL